jgi:hypothetical protein
MPRSDDSPKTPRRWNLCSPAVIGAVLTLAGFLFYDISSYFYLGTLLVGASMAIFFAGLATLLAAALRWMWRAAANELAMLGFILVFGFVMATAAPTVFAPPTMQGGEAEMFHRTPLVLAVIGGLVLLAAGARYLAERRGHDGHTGHDGTSGHDGA